MDLTGIHHLTAVSAAIRENHRFYTQTLGMRLVKRSVNQDDVSAYHLFYADAKGSPGSDLTFFDWPVPKERRGTSSVVRTALRVSGRETLDWWAASFATHGVEAGEVTQRDGRWVLDFEDPEGQRLSLIDDGGEGDGFPWDRSPIPAEYQIRGLGPITISVPELAPTDETLRQVMNMRPVREYAYPFNDGTTVHVYEMGPGGPGAELHVAVEPGLAPAQQGAGAVHHVAFRVPDDAYDAWTERLREHRIGNSGQVDRYWFAVSTSASRTASCSNSRRTGPASGWTRTRRPSARRSCWRRSSSRAGPRSSPRSSRSTERRPTAKIPGRRRRCGTHRRRSSVPAGGS